MYRLIFRSDKPEAKAFQDWVFAEVLPSIRKTGSYSVKPQRQFNNLWEERLYLFGERNSIPVGYWCVFAEVAAHCQMEGLRGIALTEEMVPDGSVGIMWNHHIKRVGFDMNLRDVYAHHYPDNRATVQAKLYPNDWLCEFRNWFYREYLPLDFPKYLQRHNLEMPVKQALSPRPPYKKLR